MATSSSPVLQGPPRRRIFPCATHVVESAAYTLGDETDSSAAVKAFRSAQADGLRDTSGCWAFAVQSGEELALATDALGTQPLYWSRRPCRCVLVAPNLHDLESSEPLRASRAKVDRSVHTETSRRDVRCVPPGTLVTIAPDGSETLQRYWHPEMVAAPTEESLDKACRDLESAIRAAVKRQIPTVGTAAHISGGLDCSTVAALAHKELRQRDSALAATYSWSPDPGLVGPMVGDEREIVRDVIKTLGVPHHWWNPFTSDSAWAAYLDRSLYVRDTVAFELYFLPILSGAGVTTVVSGWGGDEFVSTKGRSVAAWHASRGRRADSLDARLDQGAWRPRAAYVRDRARWLIDRRDPHRSGGDRWQPPRVMQERLAGLGHLQKRIRSWNEFGAMWGISYRYPLLDREVVETALQLPWQAFRSAGESRRAMRVVAARAGLTSVAGNRTKDEPALDYARQHFPEFQTAAAEWRERAGSGTG